MTSEQIIDLESIVNSSLKALKAANEGDDLEVVQCILSIENKLELIELAQDNE